ncbi:hypothetical protein SUGI_0865790 [Cryptomeria japonica]|nr:hypothetical protein SUGI_0865790 [Cryptomeria japonica]
MTSSFSVFRTGLASVWRYSSTHHISATICNGKSKPSRQSFKSNLCSTNAGSFTKPYLGSEDAKVNSSNKFIKEDSVGEFIALFEGLIESRNQTIQEAEKNGAYDPFSIEWKKWAEIFYVMKGENTAASLFSLCALPGLLKNISIASSDKPYRRDFVLYKDIPPSDAIIDYKHNFQQGEDYRNIVSPTVKLSLSDPLPEGYKSVLSPPEGYHIVLDSSSLRIISHVSREELFRSWKLDFLEQEKQINMLCRRNGLKRMEALMKKSEKERKS